MKQIKPIPYYTLPGTHQQRIVASALRSIFVPLIKRRLPSHHLAGFKQGFVPQYITKWKKEYPFFFRTDIEKFYPSVEAIHLVTQVQIAYRDLLGLPYVPKKFKEQFLKTLIEWHKSLLSQRGIPLGNPLSAILAPIALVPLILAVKRQFDVKFIVFMDDILVMSKDEHTTREVWLFIENELRRILKLNLNMAKTQSGRFASQAVSFCGWTFTGGYVKISEVKIEAFKERILELNKNNLNKPLRAYLKLMNRKIDGFGNYYKYGNVLRQFEELDGFCRREIRDRLSRISTKKAYTNAGLEKQGLHSLVCCYNKAHKLNSSPKPAFKTQPPRPPLQYASNNLSITSAELLIDIATNTTKINRQLQLLIAGQRNQNHLLSQLSNPF